MDYFLHDAKFYTKVRNINIRKSWMHYTASYLSIMNDKPYEQTLKWVEWALEKGHIKQNDPLLTIFRKDENRDRFEEKIPLSQYLKEVSTRKLILGPAMTCYLPPHEYRSELSLFTEENFYRRKSIKKMGQLAAANGDHKLATDADNMQTLVKIMINSISGAMTIASTPLYNRSGHSMLTSVCRTATSFANANVERLTVGRRHYYCGEVVLENIINIVSDVDLDRIDKWMQANNIHYVTDEELLQALKYSYDDYFESDYWEAKIWGLCQKLTPLQRSAFLYMGDMYHLKKYNETYVRALFDKIMQYKDCAPLSKEETKEEIKTIDEFYSMLISITVSHWIGPKSIYDDCHVETDYYGYIGAYTRHIRETLGEYQEYFALFWRTDNLPPETAHFQHALRTAVLGGDTDSTLFTVNHWVDWYHGTDIVNDQTKVTAQFTIYLITMIVKHTLAYVSGILGVEEAKIFNLKMKNEFYFDIFVTSNRTKHYLAIKSGKEGMNIPMELEMKGVALKNSKAPREINTKVHDIVFNALKRSSEGEGINPHDFIDEVAKIEAEVIESVLRADTTYLPSKRIKTKEAYKIPESSDYYHYELWQEVFAPKYGDSPEPPYVGVKISLNLPNQSIVNGWLEGLEDQALADRWRQFMTARNKKAIAGIILPYDVISSIGISKEIQSAINIRKVVFSIMEPFYIFGEMIGIYKINPWNTKMFIDERLEYLSPEALSFYRSAEEQALKLDEIRKKYRHLGKQYDAWDSVESYNVSEDSDQNFTHVAPAEEEGSDDDNDDEE